MADAVRRSNLDVGARTLEVNGVEYLVRGIGFVKGVEDLEQSVVVAREGTPVRVRDVARVALGPALRQGALDDEGAPAVGGVVVARYRENPQEVIAAVKEQIARIEPGLPSRTLEDGTVSQVRIVPFYDRSVLIGETLGTLSTALYQQILITVLVVLVMLRRMRSSALISGLLPLGVLGSFVLMKATGVDANIMALGGIAIAIGTMVDVGIVFVENIEQHLEPEQSLAQRTAAVRKAAAEVAPAVLTSVLTTMVSFLPVLGLTDSELRLFAPLALTKTYAMGMAMLLALLILPGAALLLLRGRPAPAASASPPTWKSRLYALRNPLAIGLVTLLLVADWLPLGPERGLLLNLLFAGSLIALVLVGFRLFERAYPSLLGAVLQHKALFLLLPLLLTLGGLRAGLSLGREYMPPFDEGSFLYMPTTMPHASSGEAQAMLSQLDAAIAAIPEVDRVVGKLGRVESALDPAPLSMIETVVSYKPEYRVEEDGTRVRQWREQIRTPRDIWEEIGRAAQIPGLTAAPTLMPINARIVMLQSGMRAPMGVKVKGPSLEAIEAFGLDLEAALREVPGLRAETVFADRVVGKPYLEIEIDREAIGRYGLSVVDVQEVLELALGGMTLTRTVEGRERYPVRVRYAREERDSVEALERIFIPTPAGEPVPLSSVARIVYSAGPQMIRSEDTFLTSYVLFDKEPELAEVEAVQRASEHLDHLVEAGSLRVPEGVSYAFAGAYENQVRSEKRLLVLVPVALSLVFILLYLQFHRVVTTLIIGSGVLVAISGGFGLLWLYGQPWFLDFVLLGSSMRDLFQVGTVNLSVAVWIGLIALIGIATDDGVVMSTYLKQVFERSPPTTVQQARELTLEAGARRVRPCLMTTATTLLALLPVITSQGRGSDIMVPLALPALGGMVIALLTLFVVPVLSCAWEERGLRAEGAPGVG